MADEEEKSEIDIFEVCRIGSLPLLEQIFQLQDTDFLVDDKDKNGKSPLHYCCCDDKLELLKMIVSKGGRLDMETSNGKSCLHIACQQSASAVVEYVMKICPELTQSVKGCFLSTHYCARGGSVPIFKRLMEAGMKPTSVINNGPTCLHVACKYGNMEMIKFLLTFDDIIQKKDLYGWNALHYTVSGGHHDVFRFLVSKDFDIQVLTVSKYSVLHISCDYNHNSLSEIIINDCPSLLHWNTKEGYSPLHIAAKRGNFRLLELLLTKGIANDVKTKNGDSVLHVCIRHHRTSMARFFITKFSDLVFTENNAGIFPIHAVVEYGNHELFDQLLSDRDVVLLRDKSKETVLHKAIFFGQTTMARQLIEKFPELIQMSDAKNNLPIDIAISKKESLLVELLSSYQEHVQDECFEALGKKYRGHLSQKDSISIIPFQTECFECSTLFSAFQNDDLLSDFPDEFRHFILSFPLPDGYTFLHCSIQSKDIFACKVLSRLFPDLLSKRNAFGEAPIHIAARLGLVDHLEVLVKAGASPSLHLRPGFTILHIAVNHKNIAFVEYVISNYPNLVNIAEHTKGLTPLHMCAESGDLSLFKMLVEDFTNLSKCTNDHKTVLEIACEKDNVEIVKYIIETCKPELRKFQRQSNQRHPTDTNIVSVFQNIQGFVPVLKNYADFTEIIEIAKENKSVSVLVYVQEQSAKYKDSTIYTLFGVFAFLFIINLLSICMLT